MGNYAKWAVWDRLQLRGTIARIERKFKRVGMSMFVKLCYMHNFRLLYRVDSILLGNRYMSAYTNKVPQTCTDISF